MQNINLNKLNLVKNINYNKNIFVTLILKVKFNINLEGMKLLRLEFGNFLNRLYVR